MQVVPEGYGPARSLAGEIRDLPAALQLRSRAMDWILSQDTEANIEMQFQVPASYPCKHKGKGKAPFLSPPA